MRYQNWKDERTTTVASCAQALRLISTTNAAQELANGYISDIREGVVAEVCASGFFGYDRINLVAQYVQQHERLPSYASTSNIQQLVDVKGLKFIDLIGRTPRNSHLLTHLVELESVGFREMSTDEIRKLNFAPNVQVVRLYSCSGDDYSWLEKFVSLRALRVVATKNFSNIGFLKSNSHLRSISLSDTGVTDLTPLHLCSNIEAVILDECEGLSDISILGKLKKLRRLKITDCPDITNLSILANLDALEELTLERCPKVSAVDSLSFLRSIVSLSLSSVDLLNSNLGLASLPQLVDVSLSSVRSLSDIEFVQQLPKLKRISVHNCPQINSIHPLKNCVEVESLRFANLSLENLNGIDGCRLLESLILAECLQLKDISAISSLPRLRDLKLVNVPGVTSLRNCANLDVLKILHIQGLPSISDLSHLENLRSLEEIRIFGCKSLFNLEPLSKLPALRSLTIVGCENIKIASVFVVGFR